MCSFIVKEYDEYTGRNPKTGERVKITPMGFTFQEQQLVIPNRDHFQSTILEQGESLSLGYSINQMMWFIKCIAVAQGHQVDVYREWI